MQRHGDEPRDQQTAWSEEQVEQYMLNLLESEKGKAILAKVLLGHLAHSELVKEAVARAARTLVVTPPSRPLWDSDLEPSPEKPIFDQTAYGHGD